MADVPAATPALRFWQATCGLVPSVLCQPFTTTIHGHLRLDPLLSHHGVAPGSQSRAPILVVTSLEEGCVKTVFLLSVHLLDQESPYPPAPRPCLPTSSKASNEMGSGAISKEPSASTAQRGGTSRLPWASVPPPPQPGGVWHKSRSSRTWDHIQKGKILL